MFSWGQGDMKRCACVWSRVVQICGVLPCLSYELLATPQGACCARKRPAKNRPCENRIMAWSFKHLRKHVIKLSAPFPVARQKHVSGNTLVRSYPKIRSKDEENFTPKMTFFRTLEIFFESGICSKSLLTIKPNKQKRMQLERLGGWRWEGYYSKATNEYLAWMSCHTRSTAVIPSSSSIYELSHLTQDGGGITQRPLPSVDMNVMSHWLHCRHSFLKLTPKP